MSKSKNTKSKAADKRDKKRNTLKSLRETMKNQKNENRGSFIKKLKARFRWSGKTRKQRVGLVLFIGAISATIWFFWGLPLPTGLSSRQPVSTRILDRNGELIYEIFTEKRSTPVALDEIPQYLINATIAIEDADFYEHRGLSITGIARAGYNIIFNQKLQGGSTLTQQLVKNALLSPERTIRRKVREVALSLIVEFIYSKDQLLEMYLNQIPYGSTAYGIEAASNLYFNKSVGDLTLAEAALLAGLPQAPSRYSPFGAFPENAKARQKTVLRRMAEEGYITDEEFETTLEEELVYADVSAPKAPHFALWIKERLAEKYGESVVEQGGLRVTTTLDNDLQEVAQTAVQEEVEKLSSYNVRNGAAIVTRPSTGEILAFVGSKDYFAEDEDGKVNILFSKRQPGSSIKPFNYALALEEGKVTASTPLADVPTCFSVADQPFYCPRNYDGAFHSAAQVRFALGNSYNIPAVRVLALNGLENFVEFAKNMGITTFTDPSNYGLSLTLGGGEVMPVDMAVAFGSLANQGIKQPLIAVTKVEDWKGKVLFEVDPTEEELAGDRVLSPETSFLVSHILLDNNARSEAFGTGSFLNVSGHPEVSVKTGTTNDLRDNWTAGYTAQAVVVTWVGNNNNEPMGGAVSGVSGASPIWNTVMKAALDKTEESEYSEKEKGHAWPRQPAGVIGRNVCWTTGNISTIPEDAGGCPSRFEYFLSDFLPEGTDETRTDIPVDKTTGQIGRPDTPPENLEIQNHLVIYDPLGTIVCLDCALPTDNITVNYP